MILRRTPPNRELTIPQTEAWQMTIGILQSGADPEAKLFAATTLKGKVIEQHPTPMNVKLTTQITYDIQQLPSDAIPSLRNQILELLKGFAAGPRPIRIQLCVCLAHLAIQMTGWKDVMPMVISALGNTPESHACILDFLKVLPEEVTQGRKINLTVCGPKDTILRASTTGVGRENTCIRI